MRAECPIDNRELPQKRKSLGASGVQLYLCPAFPFRKEKIKLFPGEHKYESEETVDMPYIIHPTQSRGSAQNVFVYLCLKIRYEMLGGGGRNEKERQ
jgi:hypothetical protein